MNTNQILDALKANTDLVRRESMIVQIKVLTRDVKGKDTCGVISTPTALTADSDFNNHYAEAQRLLNRQKKLLSLLRKSVS
jgi:hypothetical protein